MIGYIEGIVKANSEAQVILLTKAGIGYEVFYSGYAQEQEELGLYISHIIREDKSDLYGFKNAQDKKLFEQLLTVNGVGPKSAYSLMMLGSETIYNAIVFDDQKTLKSAQGVGAKAAAKIVIELKSKLTKDMLPGKNQVTPAMNTFNPILADALSACEGLGFDSQKILPIAKKLLEDGLIDNSQKLVQAILKQKGTSL